MRLRPAPRYQATLSGAWERERINLPGEQMSGVKLLLGATASQLNLATRTLSLLDGNELSYDGLVVATRRPCANLDHLLRAPVRPSADPAGPSTTAAGSAPVCTARRHCRSRVRSFGGGFDCARSRCKGNHHPSRRPGRCGECRAAASAWLATVMQQAGVQLRLESSWLAVIPPGRHRCSKSLCPTSHRCSRTVSWVSRRHQRRMARRLGL